MISARIMRRVVLGLLVADLLIIGVFFVGVWLAFRATLPGHFDDGAWGAFLVLPFYIALGLFSGRVIAARVRDWRSDHDFWKRNEEREHELDARLTERRPWSRP